jgi:hypothetical protein
MRDHSVHALASARTQIQKNERMPSADESGAFPLKELISIPGQGNSRQGNSRLGNSRDARKTLVANVIVVLFRAPAPNPPESSGGAAGS